MNRARRNVVNKPFVSGGVYVSCNILNLFNTYTLTHINTYECMEMYFMIVLLI